MTRTHHKWMRAYINGYDMSGYQIDVGNLGYSFANSPNAALSDGVKNIVNGQASIVADTFNGFLAQGENADGLHDVMAAGAGTFIYTVAYGVLKAPVAGDIIFSWPMEQATYQGAAGEGFHTVNIAWGGPTSTNSLVTSGFSSPFGRLLHASGAETDVNSATGIDDNGAASALGGIFVYHLLSSDGTCTLKAQHASANNDGSFADITGATSGSIDASTTPAAGMVATGTGLTINRYLRWQLELDTATTATFVAGFIRRLWV